MTHFYSRVRVGLSVALLGASLTSLGSGAWAQPVPPRFQVPLAQIRISPQLNTYLLARKPRVSAAVLQNAFVLRDGVPAIKLDDGTERLLLPLSTGPSPTAAGAEVPAELEAAKSYILLPTQLGKVRLEAFKVNPNLVIAMGVDRSSQMTPIRDQGPRGTCVAFAVNGAFEPFSSIPNDLSEQYSYHQFLASDGQPFNFNKGTYLTTAINVMKQGTVVESVWPYSTSIPPSNEAIPGAATNGAKYKIADTQFISDNGPSGASIKNTNYLEAILNQGHNIVIATGVAWTGSHNNDVIDVVIDDSTNKPAASRGNHAMVIVGYNSAKDYFIVRNSWGTGFGHAGYAFLSYDYVRTYMYEGFYIKAVSPKYGILRPNLDNMTIQPVRPIRPGVRIPR